MELQIIQADQQVSEMADELWGDVDGINKKETRFGKGRIMSGLTMKEVFDIIDWIPDCVLPEDNSIHYGHRR